MKIGIIGSGSFGMSLAIMLDSRHEVTVWSRHEQNIEKYLPGIEFPKSIETTSELKKAIDHKDILLFAVPAQAFRSVLREAKEYISNDTPVVNVAKGIEMGTLKRMSEIAEEEYPGLKYVCLSGPSHAEEVARSLPTTVAVSSKDSLLAKFVQEAFYTDNFRVYTNNDIIGVELGGALKNIIALGAGISDGMGFGDNAKAAIMTRGITEITRLGIKLGAEDKTFSGLTGIGDLIVTCTSMHSRNRRCGILLGKGYTKDDALKEVGMVVEGVSTVEAAYELAQKNGIEMPITEAIYHLIHDQVDAKTAVQELMGRKNKNEMRI